MSRICKKAGLPGLFLFSGLSFATAEPISLEVLSVDIRTDERTRQPVLKIAFAPSGHDALPRYTSDNLARKMELRIDGKVIMSAVIREPILGGSVQISGPSVQEMQAAVDRLSIGNARVEIEVVPD